jgi:hypothetical protein
MITTLTYTRNNEQLTLTLETGPLGGVLSQKLDGETSFKGALQDHLAETSGTYEGLLTLCYSAVEELDLHLTVKYEGDPPDPGQDVIFD